MEVKCRKWFNTSQSFKILSEERGNGFLKTFPKLPRQWKLEKPKTLQDEVVGCFFALSLLIWFLFTLY
ncbi:hypothetical protein MRB53_023027 [Persea americana]|uniref:Uncharacterized protein n=1 Tax=Persea americana TaxID=3435 RepID=A0ACC2L8C7_PERAE|nr:hypothetical protein MRB53_023027 [Persea americana]